MTERTSTPPAEEAAKDPEVREAKGAAHEAIGKLLGDDQAVRDGQSEQRDANARDRTTGATQPTKQSKTEQE